MQATKQGRRVKLINYQAMEKFLFTIGSILLLVSLGFLVYGSVLNSRALDAFDHARVLNAPQPDQQNWSSERKARYLQDKVSATNLPTAILHIDSINMAVPVFGSTGEVDLNRGAGTIEGTALPGGNGNIAIAGHRDGYFRALKDIELGDVIELETLASRQYFRVTDISIVDPLDVSVLEPTVNTEITLVTCYPFYFVGFAPERFIVRGTLEMAQASL